MGDLPLGVDVDFFFNFIFALMAAITRLIMLVIHEEQKEPYMDEVFHVPQARLYCYGNFSYWDPMITTLPGLYLTTVGILEPLKLLLKYDFCESIYWFRYTNFIFCLATFYISTFIISKLQKTSQDLSKRHSTLIALNLTTFPVLYFFSFLYYTDFGSTFFILFAYYFQLCNRHTMAAIMGGTSILFRQTNVVWVIFLAWLSFIPLLNGSRKIKPNHFNGRNDIETTSDPVKNIKLFWKSITHANMKTLYALVEDFVDNILPYAIVIVSFAIFVKVNNGIVVGAKTDHQASLHISQLLYFLAFAFYFLLPMIPVINTISDFIKHIKKRTLTMLITLTSILVIIHYTTMAHKYLLSDNRHYTFYIWKNIFQKHWSARYLISPVYLFAGFSLWRLTKSIDILWRIGFVACLCLAIIPAPLIELRYFIIPFLLLRLNVHNANNYFKIGLEFFFFCLMNVITLGLFIKMPFKWPNSDEVQRFMF